MSDAARLEALESVWWTLFARVPTATPFAAPAWLLPWWRIFAPGELFTVAIWHDDALVGLAPLYREDGAYGRRLLPLGIGLTDALDILLDPDHAGSAAAELGRVLRDEQARFDCWSAEEAPPGAAVLAMSDPVGWRSALTRQSACPVLALPTSAPWQHALPSLKRRKLRMAQNRVARRGWSLTAATPATLPDDLAHLFRLHGERWESRGETGVLASTLVRRFHEAAAPALLAANLLRPITLRIEGVAAGIYYGLQHGPVSYAYLGGFDPDFAFESPGTLVIGAAIEAAAQDGVRHFNFLRGQEAYKYEWGALDKWNQRRLFEPVP